MGRDAEFECPRCRLDPAPIVGHRSHCPRCGAELVSAHGLTEAGIRAHLYESGRTRASRSSVPEAAAGTSPVDRSAKGLSLVHLEGTGSSSPISPAEAG